MHPAAPIITRFPFAVAMPPMSPIKVIIPPRILIESIVKLPFVIPFSAIYGYHKEVLSTATLVSPWIASCRSVWNHIEFFIARSFGSNVGSYRQHQGSGNFEALRDQGRILGKSRHQRKRHQGRASACERCQETI